MPCFHPKPAWQAKLGGQLSFTYDAHMKRWRYVAVPCGTCQGCVKAHAQAWAFRCHLEATRHLYSAFVTLTYDETHCPVTLQKRHVQLWLKRLRERISSQMGRVQSPSGMVPPISRIRFFASGEYGTYNQRPHYHAILFGFLGVGATSAKLVQDTWRMGITETAELTPKRVAYAAAYSDKKAAYKLRTEERIDPSTGEVYQWQPPFILMSRGGRTGHGLGGHARQFKDSWRLFAVHDGNKIPVPRYLHAAWRAAATEQDLAELQAERDQYLQSGDRSQARLDDAEKIATKKQQLATERRYA